MFRARSTTLVTRIAAIVLAIPASLFAQHGSGAATSDKTDPAGEGTPAAQRLAALYPLNQCPVSGKTLGEMGEPVQRQYGDRQVLFCCEGCVGRFEADLADSLKQLDAAIIADQKPWYPTDKCLVSGEPLTVNGEDIAVDVVYRNRLVRFCCKRCEQQFNTDPAAVLNKLDALAADAQRESYPLSTCVVSTQALGSMGEPAEIVLRGRLIRLCCAHCDSALLDDPQKYLVQIDQAWHGETPNGPAKDGEQGGATPGHSGADHREPQHRH